MASFMYEDNQRVLFVSADLVKINLASVIIGNGPTHNLRRYPIISVKGLIDRDLERELRRDHDVGSSFATCSPPLPPTVNCSC